MRGALMVMSSVLASGCLGAGGEEGSPGPVPVTGRWRQIFPDGELPPFDFIESYEFRDDGTFTDLARDIGGTYIVDRGVLTTTYDPGFGIGYRASGYLREDGKLLLVAMYPRRTDDGWVGTWLGDEVRSDSASSVETDWSLELRADLTATFAWTSSVDAGDITGVWSEENDGDWIVFRGDGNRIGFATLQGRALGRLAFEQF